MTEHAWSRQEFEQKLREKGAYYHIHHPFHKRMNEGHCSVDEIQGWVANRLYYQMAIPVKDAAILANCEDQSVRRTWIQRIIDHDGREGEDGLGGIEAWLRLGEAVGLDRSELLDETHLLPAVKFAVNAYVNFARRASWEEAACSSLTEMFAPEIHQSRLDTWPRHYTWIDSEGFTYFQMRLSQARRDVEHGLQITLDHFVTRQQQEHALNILQFKIDILWSIADAICFAYEYKRKPFDGIADQRVCHKGRF
ncbi:pyrroloquinoline quinone biosynthesis protein PqqC [Alteromonas macleodii]|uniref:pyrroloquinoline-quinone synthase PqqC n=1 Tax=Alteromonas macleodii TaxID=28108 RepID=UPI00057F3C9A|nr:pyrroloquinoline-quinone synthase PqqC [Alteromonas macleodii]KHT55118.1 pyrroloquinoline quinone biosynthesis protein PqqC [Alteromonas macleodii]